MALVDVKVPNIGDFENVPVVEVQVKTGQTVAADEPLITLESDKAALDIPAPEAGRVTDILISVGDKVSEGAVILRLETGGTGKKDSKPADDEDDDKGDEDKANTNHRESTREPQPREDEEDRPEMPRASSSLPVEPGLVHASPSVRRIAHELDVDLTKLKGSGEKGRITKDDVKRHIVESAGSAMSHGVGIPEIPAQDFAKFGPIETKPMSRLQRLAGPHLHRSWLNIPHVTNSDEADITELESYRKSLDETAKASGYRVTLVSFLLKASVFALKQHPNVNASLAPSKDALILKRYYNIGVAVDTPDGLVVPVIRDVDRKGILELSQELTAVSERMREGRITPTDIQGSTFSISSIGGIGGTGFTPIVNAPEVAILGVVRAVMKPVWDGKTFQPRLMLPICLSYDHRAIDGALAARFLRKMSDALSDVRQLVL